MCGANVDELAHTMARRNQDPIPKHHRPFGAHLAPQLCPKQVAVNMIPTQSTVETNCPPDFLGKIPQMLTGYWVSSVVGEPIVTKHVSTDRLVDVIFPPVTLRSLVISVETTTNVCTHPGHRLTVRSIGRLHHTEFRSS